MPGDKRTTTQQGLGWAHQRLRAKLLPAAYGKPCPLCQRPMLRGQELDLDHAVPRALGGRPGEGRMAHATCNRRRGSRLGHALRRARKQQQPPANIHARRW